MSEYKHKEEVRGFPLIIDGEWGLNNFSQIVSEIDEVYAKAEAFDEIMSVYESTSSSTDDILESVENAYMDYESGDPDV